MENMTSPRKKTLLKSPGVDPTANINPKTSITCTNVPEGLFDATAAKKHFSKFGRVQKIRLVPKKQMCIIEYDQPLASERALLNAGAYDGFMFDVTRTKPRIRKRSKKEDDPDWVPDSDVEEELSVMRGAPAYRITRQKPMEVEGEVRRAATVKKILKQSPIRKRVSMPEKIAKRMPPISGVESPVAVVVPQTSLSTSDAAMELHQLRSKVSLTPDECWRTLDARDRILRAWGGAGSRVKVGGATIGTCPDMCPEKELLQRMAEHQVMTLETVPGSDGLLEPWRAVKQYSRSSADQEIPMCYELRPTPVLMRTCVYLLHEVANTKRQVTLADWFHFMWDRLRSIRKDITQQALCCAESISLVEMCARFHAHCAARLADLEHTQFDQKLNTDNLTKCLQTLKHMYADVGPDAKPREAEFRGYIALLNLGDANFWWEIKQLPLEIQKSEEISVAIEIFNALDNNNYVKFFRLIKMKATYLQACILLRYFNDVRARALARIVKAYAPRGGSRYPAEELMNSLAFESVESMKSFVNHYGLRFSKDETELIVILDRNQFIEDMDPYPVARAINLIESKRKQTVGEVIAGGLLPSYNYINRTPYSSFNKDGKLKETALIAEDIEYNTINDSNKDVRALKSEMLRLAQSGRNYGTLTKPSESKVNLSVTAPTRTASPSKPKVFVAPVNDTNEKNTFSFKPAIPVASTDVIKNSPEKLFNSDIKNIFSFSKPQNTMGSNLYTKNDTTTFSKEKNLLDSVVDPSHNNLFGRLSNDNKAQDIQNIFKKSDDNKFIFSKPADKPDNQFGNITNNLFTKREEGSVAGNIFSGKNIFASAKNESKAIFANVSTDTKAKSIFGSFNNVNSEASKIFANGDVGHVNLSPGSLFKSAINADSKSYSIFNTKNKVPSVADNIFNSINTPINTIYDFNNEEPTQLQLQSNDDAIKKEHERKLKEEQERILKEQQERILKEQQERIFKEEQERIQKEKERLEKERLIEQKRIEEKRKEEERREKERKKEEERQKQEELRRKLEEERKAELKRRAEEERKLKERIDRESEEVIEELLSEITDETVKDILRQEMEDLKQLVLYANGVTEEIWQELCDQISISEMKAEKLWTDKLMKKWFYIWRKQFIRNSKRRSLLDDTPVWLPEKSPVEEAVCLKRWVEKDALRNMNAIHRGYKFVGELRLLPPFERYNLMEVIKSPLLKRMKQINYPYNKCFFWKVTLVSTGETQWLYKKIQIEKWILDVLGDNEKHNNHEDVIQVGKQSWNNLIDFAISVSLTNNNKRNNISEAMDGSNGLLFFITENDLDKIIAIIEDTLKFRHTYHVVPIAILMPKTDLSRYCVLEQFLHSLVNKNIISHFRILPLDAQNILDSLNGSTKSALRWLAKNFPLNPPLEIDFLKSICQRYLGNELWCKFRSERHGRMDIVLKDLQKLVKCYNTAVDKLRDAITNEDLFNYPSFPLEFRQYLDENSPYPKPYEFIPNYTRNVENISSIKNMMEKLKLPIPASNFQPSDVVSMQNEIRSYCNQIGWFENPEEVVCKVVAVLPSEFSNLNLPCEQFNKYLKCYDLIDILNVIVYEKIYRLNNFENKFAVYEKSVLENYGSAHWLYDCEALSSIKHKPLEYEDDLDVYIKAKRRKIVMDSMEQLALEERDFTIVEENIKTTNESIIDFSNCKDAVKQLEKQIEDEKQRSIDLENLLEAALSNV